MCQPMECPSMPDGGPSGTDGRDYSKCRTPLPKTDETCQVSCALGYAVQAGRSPLPTFICRWDSSLGLTPLQVGVRVQDRLIDITSGAAPMYCEPQKCDQNFPIAQMSLEPLVTTFNSYQLWYDAQTAAPTLGPFKKQNAEYIYKIDPQVGTADQKAAAELLRGEHNQGVTHNCGGVRQMATCDVDCKAGYKYAKVCPSSML